MVYMKVKVLGILMISITYRTMDPTKVIKGYINGRMVPTNPSRLDNLSGNIDKLSGNIDKLSRFINNLSGFIS